jgi:hypothetical protein
VNRFKVVFSGIFHPFSRLDFQMAVKDTKAERQVRDLPS